MEKETLSGMVKAESEITAASVKTAKKPFSKIKNWFAAAQAMAFAIMATVTSASAWGESVTINDSDDPDAKDLMGNIIGILLTITRFVGIALVIYGIYEIVMSFMQNQPEAKTKGIVMALAGVVMIALKSILQGLNILG